MKPFTSLLLLCGFLLLSCTNPKEPEQNNTLKIKKTEDFVISGDGKTSHWMNTEWVHLEMLNGSKDASRSTKVKILYSDTGIYFLFSCEDTRLTATLSSDNLRLWEEDVVEIFLAPDPGVWDHFEYELSPLNYELALMVSNKYNTWTRWVPFYLEEKESERTPHQTSVWGGIKESHANIDGWMAEFFIPYRLLNLFENIPPKSGTIWRANMYRVDYDYPERERWAWQPVSGNFHNTDEYGFFLFD